MPDWLNQLKSGLLSGGSPQAHLAAFGKHPGWDDHLDDLGMNTEALLALRQYLYVVGIGAVLDSGVWDSGEEGAFLPGFKHLFAWTAGTDVMIGRMWSSSDGKSRKRYPMVVCAHFQNADFDNVLQGTSDFLARAEVACRATTSAAEVAAIVKAGHEEMQKLPGRSVPPSLLAGRFRAQISQVSGIETLPRLAYAFDTYLGPFAPGKVNRKELALNLRLHQARILPQHLRVPGDASNPVEGLRYWRKLIRGLIDEAVPLLIIAPLEEHWIDVIAGPITAQQLGCLRMTPKLAPLSSDVPFSLDAKAAVRAAELFPEKAA